MGTISRMAVSRVCRTTSCVVFGAMLYAGVIRGIAPGGVGMKGFGEGLLVCGAIVASTHIGSLLKAGRRYGLR